MKAPVALILALATALPTVASAAVSCPNRIPSPVFTIAEDSVGCQTAIAKGAVKFFKTKMKKQGKCLAEQVPGLCPTATVTEKVEGEYQKQLVKISEACATDSVQLGLGGAYGALTDPAPIASCMLSQHNASADILLGIVNGTPGVFSPGSLREKCVAAINKNGIKSGTDAFNIITKCISKQMKDGVVGDLTQVCVGSWSGATFTPPSDEKTAEKLAKLQGKIETAIMDKCTPAAADIETIFACPGAQSVADLQACLVCEGWSTAVDLLGPLYAQAGTYVTPGPGALQAAVNAAPPGGRLLVASGNYVEVVSLQPAVCAGGANVGASCTTDSECPGSSCTSPSDGLQIIGCGSATDDRPRIVKPAGLNPNGIFSSGTANLRFESLDLFDWDDNGIFVSAVDGVTFRNVFADGNDNSEYGIFPVQSNNVVVEGSRVVKVEDAGIYVGQSTNILVRYNSAELNVAGIEIENSANALVHNNYAAGNTGGILVFKLPGLPVQLSNDHEVFSNVVLNNNNPNTGGGTVGAVPDGTGMLVISTDTSDFHHNIVLGNNSFGFAMVDQQILDALSGNAVFMGVYSADQKTEGNSIHDNLIVGNAGAPDSTPPNNTPLSANILFVINEDTNHNNCFTPPNGSSPTLLTANDCIP